MRKEKEYSFSFRIMDSCSTPLTPGIPYYHRYYILPYTVFTYTYGLASPRAVMLEVCSFLPIFLF